jgi:uncharacterized protein (DUF2164 family)
MSSVAIIENSLKAIDITRLAEYTKRIQEIGQGFYPMLAPIFIRDFIIAYDITNTFLAEATKADVRADTAIKRFEAIAFLEKAGAYFEANGIKDTAAARERYVHIDDDVMAAREAKAKTIAICKFLYNKLQEFRCAHDSVRKIAYTQSFQSDHEGM